MKQIKQEDVWMLPDLCHIISIDRFHYNVILMRLIFAQLLYYLLEKLSR